MCTVFSMYMVQHFLPKHSISGHLSHLDTFGWSGVLCAESTFYWIITGTTLRWTLWTLRPGSGCPHVKGGPDRQKGVTKYINFSPRAAKMHKISPATVRNALNFASDGKKCEKFCFQRYAGGPLLRKKVQGPRMSSCWIYHPNSSTHSLWKCGGYREQWKTGSNRIRSSVLKAARSAGNRITHNRRTY